MGIHFYKMANSSVFSYAAMKAHFNKTEDFWQQFISNFTSTVFGACVSVLIGVGTWNSLGEISLIRKALIVVFAILVVYFAVYFLTSFFVDRVEYIRKVFVRRKTTETIEDKIEERFYTELQSMVIVAMSLSERIINPPEYGVSAEYKQNLDDIYIYQCLYYFHKVWEIIHDEIQVYEKEAYVKAVGYEIINNMNNAVIRQLKSLKNKYDSGKSLYIDGKKISDQIGKIIESYAKLLEE